MPETLTPDHELIAQEIDEFFAAQEMIEADQTGLGHYLGSQLLENANRALLEIEDIDQITHVPVAAGREDRLRTTLEAIRAQEIPPASWTVLSLNYAVTDTETDTIARNREIIREFQEQNPTLPISYFEWAYQPETPIGTVRRDLYAASISAYRNVFAGRLKDILLVGWDADTVAADPDYFRRLHDARRRHASELWVGYPAIRHERLPEETHPKFNKLLAWYDLGATAIQAIGPMHNAINLIGYLRAGGFPSAVAVAEFGVMLINLVPREDEEYREECLSGIHVTISSRRIVQNMIAGLKGEYGPLYNTGKSHTDLVGFEMPDEDISDEGFARYLHEFVITVQTLFFMDRYMALLDQHNVDPETATVIARVNAGRLIMAAVTRFGLEPEWSGVILNALRAFEPRVGVIDPHANGA